MYRTKNEFMLSLEKELGRAGIADRSEIIADFELHFADSLSQGLSEAEICSKLGSVSEIAKQYAEDEIYPVVAVVRDADPPPPKTSTSSSDYENSGYRFKFNKNVESSSDYENSGIKVNIDNIKNTFDNKGINWGGLLVCLCVDIFVLSWALGALFALFTGLLAMPVAFLTAAIGSIVVGIVGNVGWFASPATGLLAVFLGLMFLSLGGLLALAGVQLVKLFIKIIKAVIDWHGNMITGKPVFNQKATTAEEVSA